MPVQRCQRGGRAGHKWGKAGFCYVGKESREKAAAQGRAIQSRRQDANPPPRGSERDYRVLMTRRLRELQKLLKAAVLSAMSVGVGQILAAIATVKREWTEAFPASGTLGPIQKISRSVGIWATRKTAEAVEKVVAISVADVLANAGAITPLHERWAANGVALVGSLEERHVEDISKFITEAVSKGKSTREVEKVLSQRLGVSRRRANLIARNEIGTLNAEITRARMKDLGIKRFRWVDSGDDVVRPLHQEINGQVFDYPNGHPTEGLPGEPINCRCTAEPVL